jgi:tetratricopeptide (TPR) repeat protein
LPASEFFDEDAFEAGIEQELALAEGVEQRIRTGQPAFVMRTFDVTFVSNAREKLAALVKDLVGYRFEKPEKAAGNWEVSGTSMSLPVGENTVVYWAFDLYCRGFEHDCKLEAYGAMSDGAPVDLTKPAKHYFDEAMAAYEAGNGGLAIALFSVAIEIEPDNPNSWYSRACVKDQIQLSLTARSDYDRAIELAPDFTTAIVNRGANKDAAGEHAAAIEDYDRAIAINGESGAAFLNRGNSKHSLGDLAGAIADWKVAAGLGVATAKKRLAEHEK